MSASKVISGAGMKWYQLILSCPSKSRGIHKITDFIVSSKLFSYNC